MRTAHPASAEALAEAFGIRVRGRRDAAGMTLEQLSERSGVSRAMLSKVERGEKSPTIGIATRIAHALEATLSQLVGADPASRAAVVTRRDQRPVFRDPDTGFERHVISPAGAGSRVEVLYHHLPPGVSTGLLPAYPHGTEKQVIVEHGDLCVSLPGAEQSLGPGDALFFEADVEHAFENRSKRACGYILVVSRRP